MVGPFRDQAAADREELLSLEQQRRDLEARMSALRGQLRMDCGHRAWLIVGALLVPPTLFALWVFLAWACLGGSHRSRASLHGAEVVAVATELYLFDSNDRAACPDLAALIASKKLEAKKSDDAWGRPYRIACSSDGVWAYSLGRDGVAHTADDIASDMPRANLETVEKLSK